MSRRAVALIGLALAAAAGELVGRSRPARPDWSEEIHPLLGAAPRLSFAREPDADPWLDFAGRSFERVRPASERRILLVGGARACAFSAALEARVAPARVVVAAREDLGSLEEAIVAARFAGPLGASTVVAIDGDELTTARTRPGWTDEWDWNAAAVESPLGELLARESGLARLVFLPRRRLAPRELAEERYLRGVRSLAVLARAKETPLLWTFVGEPAGDVGRRAAEAVETAGGRAFAGPSELARDLAGR